jgi:multiple sugar transport system substrate-binding protein
VSENQKHTIWWRRATTLAVSLSDRQWTTASKKSGAASKFEEWLFPAQLGVKGKDGHHYFLPFHANVQIGYYRKNLFEDPQEQAAFKAKYGYELAAPKTMQEVEDIATFFTRPAQSLYGLTSNWGSV